MLCGNRLPSGSKIGDVAAQARSLAQLGTLYHEQGRREEAAALRQLADKCVEVGDQNAEGWVRSNLADTLSTLRRFDEARAEIRQAIECKSGLGHAAEPWKTWGPPTLRGRAETSPLPPMPIVRRWIPT